MIRYTPRTALGASLLLVCSWGHAETMTATYQAIHKGDKFEVIMNDESSGRMVFYSTTRATQKQLQGTILFDGATGGSSGFWEASKGISQGKGTVKYEKTGDVYQTEWNGVCFPQPGADGKPVPHCYGGWYLVPSVATGRFAGLKGGGSWKAKMLPSGEFEEEWIGNFER